MDWSPVQEIRLPLGNGDCESDSQDPFRANGIQGILQKIHEFEFFARAMLSNKDISF